MRQSSEYESHLGFGGHGAFGSFGGFGRYNKHGKRDAEADPAPQNEFGHSLGGHARNQGGQQDIEVPAPINIVNFLTVQKWIIEFFWLSQLFLLETK